MCTLCRRRDWFGKGSCMVGWDGSMVVLRGSIGPQAFASVPSMFLFTSEDKKEAHASSGAKPHFLTFLVLQVRQAGLLKHWN